MAESKLSDYNFINETILETNVLCLLNFSSAREDATQSQILVYNLIQKLPRFSLYPNSKVHNP